jgi:hypothetical protein
MLLSVKIISVMTVFLLGLELAQTMLARPDGLQPHGSLRAWEQALQFFPPVASKKRVHASHSAGASDADFPVHTLVFGAGVGAWKQCC